VGYPIAPIASQIPSPAVLPALRRSFLHVFVKPSSARMAWIPRLPNHGAADRRWLAVVNDEYLASKANEGQLSADEDAEYNQAIDAMDMVAILQAEARAYLRQRC
jgi:hypothetical protein